MTNNQFIPQSPEARKAAAERRRAREQRRRVLLLRTTLLCCVLTLALIFSAVSNIVRSADAREVVRATCSVSLDSEDVGYRLYVPVMAGSRKTYSDYKSITAQSVQKDLQYSAWTDEHGFRRYGDEGYYMVVLGSYYGEAGDIVRIAMKNGYIFDAIIGDVKADSGTDGWNMYSGRGNLLSFLVDTDEINSKCVKHGDMSYATPIFSGEVDSMYEVVTEK